MARRRPSPSGRDPQPPTFERQGYPGIPPPPQVLSSTSTMSYTPLLASSSPPMSRNTMSAAMFAAPNPQTGGLTINPSLPSVNPMSYNLPPPPPPGPPTSSRKRKQPPAPPPVDPSLSGPSADANHNQNALVAPAPSAAPGTPGPPSAAGPAATPAAAGATGAAAAPATPSAPSQTVASPPTAKKSRTNTPWTPMEEQRLKAMRDAGSSWSDIAKTFPTRTEGSVKKHWYKDMHYAEFAEDESAALLAAIKEYETNKWKVIGQKVGKPAKACEQYAKEHFGGKT